MLELFQAVSIDLLVLHLEHASLRPLAVRAETNVADNRVVPRLVDVFGHFVLIEAVARFSRRGENLHAGIGEGRQVITERIDAGRDSFWLVTAEKFLDAGEVCRRFGHKSLERNETVQQRTK